MEIKIKSRKYGEKTFYIDEEDYEKVKKYTWHLDYVKHMDKFYISSTPIIDGKKKKIRLQRYLMNCPEGLVVDHIDRKPLNNLKENLRICTNAENSRNSGSRSTTCKYKGVFFIKRDKVFCSAIRFENKLIYLGRFKEENNAAKAYNDAALKYFGDFARLNEIEGEIYEEETKKYYSSYRGVSFDKSRNKYVSNIAINKKFLNLGRYDTELEAAIAYNLACDKYGLPERKNMGLKI